MSAAEGEFSRMGWAFREQHVADYGIDAQVEPFLDGDGSGKLIALQIKSGCSFFTKSRKATGGWTYRGRDSHLRYWLRYCMPVVLLLHNPDSQTTYWAHITPDAVEYTDSGWKILVPSDQILGPHAREALWTLAESAPGASDDPVEISCAQLPPTAAGVLLASERAEPGGTLRLAAQLARGRYTPPLTITALLSVAPSWLSRGEGRFEVALAMYAGEHGHPGLAAEALIRAASYDKQPVAVLLAHAALSAAEAGDAPLAKQLIAELPDDGNRSLLIATARAVVRHLGQPGLIPVPSILGAASPAERAAEPTCLSFLGAQALRRQDAIAAVRYFEEALSAQPTNSSLMIQLARGLQARIVAGQSAVEANDMRRIEELARTALDQRRRWAGPSSSALATLIRQRMLAGAFEAAVHLATPVPDGEALEDEATADEVVILGTQAALTIEDRARAADFASRARSGRATVTVAALMADSAVPPAEQADLWRAVLAEDPLPESKFMALHRLACLGIWPLPEVEELREADEIDDLSYDILAARAAAGRGDLTAAVSALRCHASSSPIAAEMIVDVLQEADRYEEALDEAIAGFERFGETILAHKRLNLFVFADRPDEAAAEAVRLLSQSDTAPELRQRMRRRLIGHHAHKGDWSAIIEQARAALGESDDQVDMQWNLIAATCNQGQIERAWDWFAQFNPEVTSAQQGGIWVGLHMHHGFDCQDVNSVLDFLDRWPQDASFVGRVLAAFLAAAGMRRPDGAPILPVLDPQTQGRFQARLLSYATENPDGLIQPIGLAPGDLADMLRAQLAPHAERIEVIERFVREGRVSLGVLAAMLGRSYAGTLLQRAGGVLLAVTPDPGVFATELHDAQAALDGPVVIQSSAIAVSTIPAERWAHLRDAFSEVRLPQNAWTDFQAARAELLQDPDTTFSTTYDRRREVLVNHRLSEADRRYLIERFAAVDAVMRDITLVASPGLGVFADYALSGIDVALSSLALAAETSTPLWSDDIVIRGLAAEHGIPTFSTLSLLQVLIETDRLPDTLREDVLSLAREYVADIMLTPEELLRLAAESHYQPGPATAIISRQLFWAVPEIARTVFLELIGAVNNHAPGTLAEWFRAACGGLAVRLPKGVISRQTGSLAAAVSAHISSSDDIRALLFRIADAVTEAHQSAEPG